ncbi:MAG: PLP-dependent aminotransferase family protein [Cellulosilyticaceae bacterium]
MFCAIRLSKNDPTPLYVQLAEELSKLIKSGTLPPKTKLPTIRLLSSKLHINRDTVVSAYKRLENQGLVNAHMGSGTYVGSTLFGPTTEQPKPIPCSSLSFPKEIFSTDLLQNLLTTIAHTEGWNAFSDPLRREQTTIREYACKFLTSAGVKVPTAQLHIVNSFSNFLINLIQMHPNNTICVEAHHDLTYTSYLKSRGTKIVEIPMTNEGMSIPHLELELSKNKTSFIWLSSYVQNPTGIHYSEKTKSELLRLAKLHNCFLIEDGTYNDFVHDTVPLKPLFSLDKDDCVIFLYHFSKLYLPHLQYSFVALPKMLTSRLLNNYEYTFNERVLYFYMQSNAFASLKLKLHEMMHSFHETVKQFLDAHTDTIECYTSKQSLLFWIRPLNTTIENTIAIFLRYNIIVSPSELFCFKSTSKYVRLSLSNITHDTLPLLLKALEAITAAI